MPLAISSGYTGRLAPRSCAADCLLKCNDHFRLRGEVWKQAGKDPRYTRVRIVSNFSHILIGIVASGDLRQYPCLQQRDYILDKLFEFQRLHDIDMSQRIADLDAFLKKLLSTNDPHGKVRVTDSERGKRKQCTNVHAKL